MAVDWNAGPSAPPDGGKLAGEDVSGSAERARKLASALIPDAGVPDETLGEIRDPLAWAGIDPEVVEKLSTAANDPHKPGYPGPPHPKPPQVPDTGKRPPKKPSPAPAPKGGKPV